jgi:preprotein translocase subunit SecG
MQVLNIFHVLIAIALVAFVLIQKGQGATAGAAFGSGASGTVFGSRGAGNFLTRSTWVLATLFCTISLTMAVMVSRMSELPENDLGVVGSQQLAPAVEEGQQADEVSLTSDEPLVTDMPSFDTESASDDLPVLDTTVGEPVDDAITEELQAVKEEQDSTGTGSDDS